MSRHRSAQVGWRDPTLLHPHEYHIEALLQGCLVGADVEPANIIAHMDTMLGFGWATAGPDSYTREPNSVSTISMPR